MAKDEGVSVDGLRRRKHADEDENADVDVDVNLVVSVAQDWTRTKT